MKRLSYSRMIEHIAYTPGARDYLREWDPEIIECAVVRTAAILFDVEPARVMADIERIWLREQTRPGGADD